MAEMRFDNQSVVITDGASGSGQACALWLAARGANLVVNQPWNSSKVGFDRNKDVVSTLVSRINGTGGKSIATYESVENGANMVETAIENFGGIDVLLNNTSFQHAVDFRSASEEDTWKSMLSIDLRGAYRCAKAVWPHFRKRAHGRTIFTTLDFEQSRLSSRIGCSAARMALFGFAETLSQEGARYNITVNVIAASGPSFVTEDADLPFKPPLYHHLTPLVGALIHNPNNKESGSIFEVAHDRITKLRWERAEGALSNPDKNPGPGSLFKQWAIVNDFSTATHPQGPQNFATILPKARQLAGNEEGGQIDFQGKVVVITGAGAGLGRAYALAFGRAGAKVVVNDLKDPTSVVHEIQSSGGTAIANIASVEDGKAVIKTAIEAYARIDILVNNAGFVRDKSFANMTDAIWNPILAVHLNGTYQVTKAAWPYFLKQGYGRVVSTTSTSGIYGNFGQSNYATAKLGILGLSDAFAREGRNHNIFVNTIAPVASTGGLATALDGTGNANDQIDFKPEYLTPLVMLLCSDKLAGTSSPTGQLYEASCGWHTRTRLQRSSGFDLLSSSNPTPEALLKAWDVIVDFDNQESSKAVSKLAVTWATKDVLENIKKQMGVETGATEYDYTDREVLLYNLAIGATRSELPLVYEGSPDFHALPTFGVIPFFSPTVISHNAKLVLNFNPTRSLLGEHYLEIRKYPIPTSGKLISTSKLLNVVDKGNAAISITGYTTRDKVSGEEIFYNEVSFFMRGSGGFSGTSQQQQTQGPSSPTSSSTSPPSRTPDSTIIQHTTPNQAALYRLTGDRMAMHIDTTFSRQGGFLDPILHGACFMGIAGKHVYQTFGAIKNIKVRFAGVVVPGQTLKTEMWRDNKKSRVVVFQQTVLETGKLCIVGGRAELMRNNAGAGGGTVEGWESRL